MQMELTLDSTPCTELNNMTEEKKKRQSNDAYAVFMLSAASEEFGSPSTRYISFFSPHLFQYAIWWGKTSLCYAYKLLRSWRYITFQKIISCISTFWVLTSIQQVIYMIYSYQRTCNYKNQARLVKSIKYFNIMLRIARVSRQRYFSLKWLFPTKHASLCFFKIEKENSRSILQLILNQKFNKHVHVNNILIFALNIKHIWLQILQGGLELADWKLWFLGE